MLAIWLRLKDLFPLFSSDLAESMNNKALIALFYGKGFAMRLDS